MCFIHEKWWQSLGDCRSCGKGYGGVGAMLDLLDDNGENDDDDDDDDE